MLKTISEIYTEYKIMPVLERHMLRVAAVASLVCDNFDEPLNKNKIIITCLLHDMGNIIKPNLEFLPEFLAPEGKEYWSKVKEEYIKKYGNNEDVAHEKIMQELNIDPEIISLVRDNIFSRICEHKNSDDIYTKIIHYADMRVSPYGVVSYEERMDEAKIRYKLKTQAEEDERGKLILCGKEIEKQIFAKCKIKPEDINDESVESVILELKNFVVK